MSVIGGLALLSLLFFFLIEAHLDGEKKEKQKEERMGEQFV
jgi:hypothetical protein